jgi:hypothetical protein
MHGNTAAQLNAGQLGNADRRPHEKNWIYGILCHKKGGMPARFEFRLDAVEFVRIHGPVTSRRRFLSEHNCALPAKVNCAIGSMLQLTNEFRVETCRFDGHRTQWEWSFRVIWREHSRGSGRSFAAWLTAVE